MASKPEDEKTLAEHIDEANTQNPDAQVEEVPPFDADSPKGDWHDWTEHVELLKEKNPDEDFSDVPKESPVIFLAELLDDPEVPAYPGNVPEWEFSFYVDGVLNTRKSTKIYEIFEVPGKWEWKKFLPTGEVFDNVWPHGAPCTEEQKANL